MELDDITGLTEEELRKVDLYSQIKHRVEQETHMRLQEKIWAATVFLLALGIIFK